MDHIHVHVMKDIFTFRLRLGTSTGVRVSLSVVTDGTIVTQSDLMVEIDGTVTVL